MVRQFESHCQHRKIEPLRFNVLHGLAQLQSIHDHLATLVSLVGALSPDGLAACGVEVPPPQVVFPSGRLAHHIAVQLGSMSAEKRMPCVLTEWLPRLLGRVDDTFMSQVGRLCYLRAFTTSVT